MIAGKPQLVGVKDRTWVPICRNLQSTRNPVFPAKLSDRRPRFSSKAIANLAKGPLFVFGPILAGIFLIVESVWASGFSITAQGARASGKGAAFTAQADDPSAVYYNPAGLSSIRQTEVLGGIATIVPKTSYNPTSGGQPSSEEAQTFFVPHFYVAVPLTPRVSGGLGLFTPFGIATDWPQEWDGRFQVTYASVQATFVSPVLAWRASDAFTVGGGLDFAYIRLEQRKGINLSRISEDLGTGAIPGNPEGNLELEGRTTAVGFNFGIATVPTEHTKVGVAFRSRIKARIDNGSVNFSVSDVAFAPFFPDGDIATEIDLPASLRVGLLVQPLANWNIEANAVWMGWSSIDRLDVDFANGLPVARDSTDFFWGDSMTYTIGTEYTKSSWALRGGYTYDITPIPDDMVGPILPEGNRHWFSIGGGFKKERWGADLAYQLILFRRTKENQYGEAGSSVGTLPAAPSIDARANGLYRTVIHAVTVSVVRHF